ncbi:MAG: alpha-ketoglutarate-dependent dioxygenase AlkB [Alphaproteobacteria bacterium]
MSRRGSEAGAPGRRGPVGGGPARGRDEGSYLYERDFLGPRDRELVLAWLSGIEPLWEDRFSEHFPPPPGQEQRRLLRPVWWLGNWQFACLGYYRPPRGTRDRCVRAEPFPDVLARLVERIERKVRARFAPRDVPPGWRLDTCLVNLYGKRLDDDGRWVDVARVGEHRDFEPGPVASLSIGERALLQFVTPSRAGERGRVLLEQWLDDGSMQVFGGERWKDRTFHRVQRVDRRGGFDLPPSMPDFRTRRVNFTFRHVPDRDVVRFRDLGSDARADVRGYVERLARSSAHFRAELEADRR